MKLMLWKSLVTALMCCFCGLSLAQTWNSLGKDGSNQISYDGGRALSPVVTSADGTPYVAYVDYDTQSGWYVYVMKYTGGAWLQVGPRVGFGFQVSLALDGSGTPFVLYQNAQYNNKATVKKFNGTSWQVVGTEIISDGSVSDLNIAMDPVGVPYISYFDTSLSKILVKCLISGTWTTMGTGGFTPGSWTYNDLVIDASGNPCLSYVDGLNSNKATVVKLVSGGWQALGTAGFSAGSISYNSLDFDNSGNLYIAYTDGSLNNKATVLKYSAGSWQSLGAPGLTPSAAAYLNLDVSNAGVPYIAYQDAASSNKASVMRYSGGAWQTVGMPGISAGTASLISVKVGADDIPYVYFVDVGNSTKATLKKFNGASWEAVGATDDNSTIANSSVAMDNSGVPYLAFRDDTNGGKLTVKKYTGGSWQAVGAEGFSISKVAEPIIRVDDNGVLYVAYRNDVSGYKASVVKYTGGVWQNVGPDKFTSGTAYSQDFAISSSGIPYLLFKDGANSSKLTVMNFTGSSWQTVGTVVSSSAVIDPSIALDAGNIPYVGFGDGSLSNKASVMRFTNGNWEYVGSPGFSPWAVEFTDLAIDASGIPYFAYDSGQSKGANVMRFFNGSWQSVGSASAGFSPSGISEIQITIDANGIPYVIFPDDLNSKKAAVMRFFNGSWQSLGSSTISLGKATSVSIGVKGNSLISSFGYYGVYVKSVGLPPATPTNFKAVAVGNKITLSWNAVSGAASYRIYSVAANGSLSLLTETIGIPYDHLNITPGLTYSYKITALDANGESQYSETVSVVSLAPPIITGWPEDTGISASDKYTKNSKLTYIGTATANATITVAATNTLTNAVISGTTTANTSGNWTYTTAALPDGVYSITFTATDATGNTSAATTAEVWTIDTNGPTFTASIYQPATSIIQARSFRYKVAFSEEVYNFGSGASDFTLSHFPSIGTITYTGPSRSRLSAASVLPVEYSIGCTVYDDGDFRLLVKNSTAICDKAGNLLNVGGTGTWYATSAVYTVDNQPVISSIGRITASPTNANYLTFAVKFSESVKNVDAADFAPVVTNGTAVVSVTGYTKIDNNDYQVSVSVSGSATVGLNLSGANNITDYSNNSITTPYTGGQTYVVDQLPPAAPVITFLTGINAVYYTRETKPTATGTAEANAKISIFLDGGTTKIAEVTATTGGAWTYTFTSALAELPHFLTALATDAVGNVSDVSLQYNFTVDNTAPSLPVVTAVSGMNPAGYTQQIRPTVTGTAEANATISVYIDGSTTKIADVTATAGGSWAYTFTSDLSESAHIVAASARDAAGNMSATGASYNFIVDNTTPALPVVTAVSGLNAAGYTQQIRPTVTGTAEANATVSIYLDGSTIKIADVTATAGGTWTYTFTSDLSESAHTLAASATDAAGNISATGALYNFIVDNTPPTAPVVTSVGGVNAAGYTQQTRPAVSGTAEANVTVSVYLDGSTTKIADVTATPGGTWTYTFTSDLSESAHTVAASARDAAGNISAAGSAYSFIIDKTRPASTVVTAVSGINTHLYTQHVRPTVSGTAEANSTVSIFLDIGTRIADVTATPEGTWVYTFTTDLIEKLYAVSASATDAAGNTSIFNLSYSFIVDATAPVAPVVTALSGVNGAGYTQQTRPAVSGTAEPNALVALFLDGSTTKIADVTATAGGTWTYTFIADLPEAPHTLSASATDAADNISGIGTVYNFIVDATAPAAPVVTAISGMNAAGYTQQTKPAVSGTAEANVVVSIFLDGSATRIADVAATSEGTWTYTFTSDLLETAHSVSALATDAAENISVRGAAYNFIVDETAPIQPVIMAVSGLNAAGYTQQVKPVINGTAEPYAVITLYFDGIAIPHANVMAAVDGTWTYTFNSALSESPHTVAASATDAAGNVSATGALYNFIVDNTIPALPVVTAVSGRNAAGYTQQVRPAIGGTAEANATVSIYLDGSATKIADVTATSGGTWMYTFTSDLSEADHRVAASALDAAGNASLTGMPYAFYVDASTIKPLITNVSGLNVYGYTAQTKPTLMGIAEENAAVSIFLDGIMVPTEVITNAAGKWDYTFITDLAEGTHLITVRARDIAGNWQESDVTTIIVDNTEPEVPSITILPGENGATEDSSAPLAGKGTAGTIAEIYVNGQKVADELIDNTGSWSHSFNPELAIGPNTITLVGVDGAENRSETSAPVVITITPQQVNTLISLTVPVKTFGDADFTVSAETNNDQSAITYSSSDTSVIVVSENGLIHIRGAGRAIITASQEAGSAYKAATVSKEIIVNKAQQSIVFNPVPELKRYGDAFELSAAATSGLSVKLTSSSLWVARTEGSQVIPRGIGNATITISQEGDANYLPVSVQTTVNVSGPSGEEVMLGKLVTPNGDGINDVFSIEGISNMSIYYLKIMNRNGVRVFETRDYPSDPDSNSGKKWFTGLSGSGATLPEGTYFYFMEYKGNQPGKLQRKSGYFVVKY